MFAGWILFLVDALCHVREFVIIYTRSWKYLAKVETLDISSVNPADFQGFPETLCFKNKD